MKKYDIFGLSRLIERGLSRRLEIVENAINQLDPALEQITVLESFVFAVNTNNAEMYRMNYDIRDGQITFSNLTSFQIDTDTSRLDNQSKKIIRNIVEALADNNEAEADFLKSQWIANQRQKKSLENILNLNIGNRSKYISNTKKFVAEAVESVRGARSLLARGCGKNLFNRLVNEGQITVYEKAPVRVDKEGSRRQLIYSKIVEARNSAKGLVESPVFTGYVIDLYNGVDVKEAIEFIAENYQEIYTLSLSEQTEVFYTICEKSGIEKPELPRIIECILGIGHYVISKPEIVKDISELSELIGASNNNFHERMQLIEDEINSRTYTLNDLKILKNVLEGIISKPSELLAPEFIVEARKAFRRLVAMVESGNIDDAVVSATINLVSQYYPQTIGESEQSEDYQKFFRDKLAKYGVDSPEDLSDEEKKKFFNEIEKEWSGETHESNENIDSQTGFPKGVLENIKKSFDEEEPNASLRSKKATSEDNFEDNFIEFKAKKHWDSEASGWSKEKGKEENQEQEQEEFNDVFTDFQKKKESCTYDELQDFKKRFLRSKRKKEDEEALEDINNELETQMLLSK